MCVIDELDYDYADHNHIRCRIIRSHAHVHQTAPLTAAHFERWLSLFEANLDQRWAGPNTERARTLVHNVARVHAAQLGVTGEPVHGR